MKLAEIAKLAEKKNCDLADMMSELNDLLLGGSAEDRGRAGALLRRLMELWDEVDEMVSHIYSVRGRINIPQMGISLLEAQVLFGGMSERESYVKGLMASTEQNMEGANVNSDGEKPCPHCGEKRGVPIDIDDIKSIVEAIRKRRLSISDSFDAAEWQVETTWCDVDDEQVVTATSVSESVEAEDPEEAISTAESRAYGYGIVDVMCPFCISSGRGNIERHWITDDQDILSIMAYSTEQGMVPVNTNPSVARVHFDDHFNPVDHLRM